MRILVVTPWIPFPITGADQQDRFQGFLQLKKLGHHIHVIAKMHQFQDRTAIERFYAESDIPLTLVPYLPTPYSLLFSRFLSVLREPALLDGAALEYLDPALERLVTNAVSGFKPDVAWVEFTFLWPVVRLLKKLGIPSVMRSANNEAQQSIDEHAGSLLARILAIPKFRGEKLAARESAVVCAITPVEAEWYKKLQAKHVYVLPLRGLPLTIRSHTHAEKQVLDVVFLSSSYSNGHNRDALKFLLQEVIPAAELRAPGAFRFHITGQKFPESFRSWVSASTEVHGFIPDLSSFLDTMDIALCPSVGGQGMQQKIFEPLCCGLPLITHHVAGYPFVDGQSVLLAKNAATYVEHLLSLRDVQRRQNLVDAAADIVSMIFTESAIQRVEMHALEIASTV